MESVSETYSKLLIMETGEKDRRKRPRKGGKK
jgi:hypothetical protein